MSRIAAIGHLSRDIVDGAPPRAGGAVFYSARTLARIGADAHVAASCSGDHKDELLPELETFGLAVRWYESKATTEYSFRYEGDRRIMRQTAVGDPWLPSRAVDAAADAAWVHVGALTRTDFPGATLAALADGRRLLVDGQGLVRTAALGALRTDNEIGDVLRHVTILKLDAEEAEVLVGSSTPEDLRSLELPEVILTHGSRGAFVVTKKLVEHVGAHEVRGVTDPTGAGDMFAAAYLSARAGGEDPLAAARRATDAVGEFLSSE